MKGLRIFAIIGDEAVGQFVELDVADDAAKQPTLDIIGLEGDRVRHQILHPIVRNHCTRNSRTHNTTGDPSPFAEFTPGSEPESGSNRAKS